MLKGYSRDKREKAGLLSNIVWNAVVRSVLFWVLVVGTVWAIDDLSPLDVPLVGERLSPIVGGMVGRGLGPDAIDSLSNASFAFSLAGLLFAFGLGLLVAFVLMHAISLCRSLASAARLVKAFQDRPAFAQAYEAQVYPALLAHPLIGHAWREFDETLLKSEIGNGGVIGNTVRPQSFINYGILRERSWA